MVDKCTTPPEGWECTRSAGHEGPCAAVPTSYKEVPPLLAIRTMVLEPGDVVDLAITVERNNVCKQARGWLSVLDEDSVRGYLPSKIWHYSYDDLFRLSYYTNDGLNNNVRPFGNGKTYALVLHPDDGEVYYYPIEWRVFIEHVVCPSAPAGIAYVFLFGEDLYDQIITS